MYLFKQLTTLSILLITVLSLSIPGIATAQDAKVVEIKGTDQLKFTKTEITAAPGQEITVKLTTVSKLPPSAMSHNFLLLTSSVDATKVAQESAKFQDNQYIAPKYEDQIIAHTDMAGGGETVTVTFTAPEEPGDYEYICTFPGHYLGGMKGTLTVKE
ncbi:azurin [Balneolaceae bacterium YR4-1]|uniref:Azurin n=1 Tax=Halalkalibaculum roseum TaxID=2709311 RepID=A0A6M1SX40_9BACT|nr:plastocyanin/azurin family copper-binding protein [Halalkalibaculum roseum]NGP75107.1 azurin [Halalkalibaculum roseum]